jgi:hypothetical protein
MMSAVEFFSNTAILEKYFFVFGKSVMKAKFFSPKIHRQKNAKYAESLGFNRNLDPAYYLP